MEVCSACNHGCIYCPFHDDPFPQKTLHLESSAQILDTLSTLPAIKRITLNHFNEPFLDRCNASLITERLDLSVNLPTLLSAAPYRELHGRDDLERLQENIERRLAADFFVRFSVQRNQHATEDDGRSIQRACRGRVRWIEAHRSSTRGNLVSSEPVIHQGRLAGCGGRRHTDYLHIRFHGAVFLCGEDYRKNCAFGNLLAPARTPEPRATHPWFSGSPMP